MSASSTVTLYGVRGWGSSIAEGMLAYCGVAYRFVALDGFDKPGPSRDKLLAVNPLGQVPVLKLADRRIVTESAAMALILDELYPQAGLAPPAGSKERALYLRVLVWLVANVYPSFTYGDSPKRWVSEGAETLRISTDRHREKLWHQLEAMAPCKPWVLGERMSALDIYLAVMTHWRPRFEWFETQCPKLAAVAIAAWKHPKLIDVIATNFPEGRDYLD